jgi:hypothetical protein
MDKNRFLNSIKYFIIFSALFHMVLLLIYSITIKDFSSLNFINLLELDLLFPSLHLTTLGKLISWLIYLLTPIIIYFFFTKKSKK